MIRKLVWSFTLCLIIGSIDSSREAMTKMSINFTKALDACKRELDLPDSIMVDFNNFWKEEHVLTDRNTGCAIHCMSFKVDILDEDGYLHRGSAREFAMRHGADEAMAEKIITTIQNCEKAAPHNPDGCLMVLSVASCYKAEVHKLDWAPDMNVIAAELLAQAS